MWSGKRRADQGATASMQKESLMPPRSKERGVSSALSVRDRVGFLVGGTDERPTRESVW